MMSTKCSPSYLTSGCWSPTRPGVFFTTRADGVLDIWDYFYRQSEVAYSQKVRLDPLSPPHTHFSEQNTFDRS